MSRRSQVKARIKQRRRGGVSDHQANGQNQREGSWQKRGGVFEDETQEKEEEEEEEEGEGVPR